ncbi:MAG: hypothetical protein V3V10_10445 [Planctomycetota bacterium]
MAVAQAPWKRQTIAADRSLKWTQPVFGLTTAQTVAAHHRAVARVVQVAAKLAENCEAEWVAFAENLATVDAVAADVIRAAAVAVELTQAQSLNVVADAVANFAASLAV